MLLYIARHGFADQGPPNHLTPRGREDVLKVAKHLAPKLQVQQVWHSPLPRAEQTAQILAEHLGPEAPIEVEPNLVPNGDPLGLCDDIARLTADTLLVSHLPLVEILLCQLVFGELHCNAFNFSPGTVAALAGAGRNWELQWVIKPEILDIVIKES